ncbi:MAG: bacillithiol biosynthesis cysteine-adding enzyme BshC [Flavobacteriales bacterium]|nr:MAG: bacillithiol biosynthesis cysteine-adding enzyme BshC [Flavobacteriales bacterium]
MQTISIPYFQTGFFPKIFLDYLKGDEKLVPFYSYIPDIKSFKKVIKEKSTQQIDRKLLAEVLEEQHSKFTPTIVGGNSKQIQNIQILNESNTFTVTTGHQLCLFTGPVYFIYKIISTINLSQVLKKHYPDYNFVPVYWMHTEDHDFEEINHIHLFGKTLSWKAPSTGPVGRLKTDSLKLVLEELKAILGENENAKELLDIFHRAYLGNKNMADATRYLVNELFSEDGLIIIDADDKRLKNQFSQQIKDDLQHNTAFRLVNETNAKLSAHYKPVVKPRKINLFYLKNNLRERIVETDENWLNNVNTNPECFSPNVVLRPLYQEMILPNVAYVGGAVEISYWLQLKDLFEHYSVNFPVMIPRNSALWLDKKTSEKLQKLGISVEELFTDIEQLIVQKVKENSKSEINLENEKQQLESVFQTIKQKAIDKSLETSVDAEFSKVMKSLTNLESKLLKAEKRKQEEMVNQVRNIKSKLFPEGKLQERQDNFIPYYLKHGKEFIRTLKENLNPLDFRFTVLREE